MPTETAVSHKVTARTPSASRRAGMPSSVKSSLLGLDLQHLQLLSMLLHECSVTRVATMTGKVQPVVSRALAKLRVTLEDPLLVRGGNGLVPTERGQVILESVDVILEQAARLEAVRTFDPATSAREFRIALADCIPPVFFPRLISRITRAGPRIRLSLRAIDPAFDVAQALENGSIDLVVNNNPRPREDLRITELFKDQVVCVSRREHPVASVQALSLARYLGLSHLAPYPSTNRDLGPVDGELAKVGYRRNIVATVPEFSLAADVLLETDLVFTTGRKFATHFAERMPLALVPAPAELSTLHFYQLWHERNHHSAANRWLRSQLTAVAKEL